jgi:hypothetical protein
LKFRRDEDLRVSPPHQILEVFSYKNTQLITYDN